jgi:hypothetical protein
MRLLEYYQCSVFGVAFESKRHINEFQGHAAVAVVMRLASVG